MYNIDPSLDYLVWDNLEAVNLQSRRTAPGSAPDRMQTNATARRRMLSKREQSPSLGAYTHAEIVWLLPRATTTFEPKPADLITDDFGTAWTIFTVQLQTVRSVWRCTCIALAIAFDLRQLVDIWRAVNTIDAGGGRIPTFQLAYANVPCRIQETTEETADLLGRRGPVKQYEIFVGQRLYVTHEDQAKDKSGKIYQIKGDTNPDRLDELQCLTCETIVEPTPLHR